MCSIISFASYSLSALQPPLEPCDMDFGIITVPTLGDFTKLPPVTPGVSLALDKLMLISQLGLPKTKVV